MTDSTINAGSGEGAFEVGTSTDELFGAIAEDSPERDGAGSESDDDSETASETTAADGIEDRTAEAVFGELRENVSDTNGVDAVLEDETPEDIIATADEPEPEPEQRADDDLIDEDGLEELLLTDRRKEQEFLWVETDEIDGDDETDRESESDESGPSLENADDPTNDIAAESTADSGDTGADPTSPSRSDSDRTDTSTSDGDGTGLFGWLRSKLGGLF